MVDGWPIAHHVFAGNRRDAKIVPDVLRDVEERFGLRRVVLVGDRGMVTSHNIDDLRAHGHGYVVGRNRRRSGEVFDYIQSATGPWIECPVGITAREKTLVQEVSSNQPGVRVLVVHSEERQAFERAHRIKAPPATCPGISSWRLGWSTGLSGARQIRNRCPALWTSLAAMERVRRRLEKLECRIAKGQIKAAEKVGAAAARVLSRNHGHRGVLTCPPRVCADCSYTIRCKSLKITNPDRGVHRFQPGRLTQPSKRTLRVLQKVCYKNRTTRCATDTFWPSNCRRVGFMRQSLSRRGRAGSVAQNLVLARLYETTALGWSGCTPGMVVSAPGSCARGTGAMIHGYTPETVENSSWSSSPPPSRTSSKAVIG
jgi:hypothetical protein